jgi:hypothetical protein
MLLHCMALQTFRCHSGGGQLLGAAAAAATVHCCVQQRPRWPKPQSQHCTHAGRAPHLWPAPVVEVRVGWQAHGRRRLEELCVQRVVVARLLHLHGAASAVVLGLGCTAAAGVPVSTRQLVHDVPWTRQAGQGWGGESPLHDVQAKLGTAACEGLQAC